jgi:hypothetical protein
LSNAEGALSAGAVPPDELCPGAISTKVGAGWSRSGAALVGTWIQFAVVVSVELDWFDGEELRAGGQSQPAERGMSAGSTRVGCSRKTGQLDGDVDSPARRYDLVTGAQLRTNEELATLSSI